MPQIWLTYEELGALLDCETGAAREFAAERPSIGGDAVTVGRAPSSTSC